MSTDTYIDFHHADVWEKYLEKDKSYSYPSEEKRAKARNNYYAALETLEKTKGIRGEYTTRIGYLYNFINDHTSDAFDKYREKYSGKRLTLQVITDMVNDWKEIVKLAKESDSVFTDDMDYPESLSEELMDHIGWHISFRVD